MNSTSQLDPRVYGRYSKAPTSYKDPIYKDLISQAEQQAGIPQGLLASVVYAGERSNNDQVSPVGAKTMFQFMPKTREYIKNKYGFDAYASPYEGAMAAASLLKDNQQALSKYTNDLSMIAASYNTGAGNVMKHLQEGKPLAKETQGYIARTSQMLGGGVPNAITTQQEPVVNQSTNTKSRTGVQTPNGTLLTPAGSAATTEPNTQGIELLNPPSLLDTLNAFSEGKNQADGVKQDADTSLANIFHNTSGESGGMLKSLSQFM